MASAIIHIAVAKEVNKNLKMNEKQIFLGAIAPDISKQIGESKVKSHFITNQDKLDNPFIMGYYIHLFTDYLWEKYFIEEIVNKNTLKLLSGDYITCSDKEISKIIYDDYTNINISLIDKYNLDLSLFYEEVEIPKVNFKEIPLDKLQIIVDKMGIIVENSKKGYSYIFDLDNINNFIRLSTSIISDDIKMRLD